MSSSEHPEAWSHKSLMKGLESRVDLLKYFLTACRRGEGTAEDEARLTEEITIIEEAMEATLASTKAFEKAVLAEETAVESITNKQQFVILSVDAWMKVKDVDRICRGLRGEAHRAELMTISIQIRDSEERLKRARDLFYT